MSKIIHLLCLGCLIHISLSGQISHGGAPIDWESHVTFTEKFLLLPVPNTDSLRVQDSIETDRKDQPYRFGYNINCDLDPLNSGRWFSLDNGDRVWRLAIHLPQALSINFIFDQYNIPKGASIFVYDIEKTQLLGSFTQENASLTNSLGVGFLFADKAIIEYYEPAAVSGLGQLHINQVTYGYRPIFASDTDLEKAGPFGSANACNINVNCPIALPYDNQKRSVALVVINGNGHCSGALVNNTNSDTKPYFLTANHCLPNNLNTLNNWLFYFNHETPACIGNQNAPTNQSISGAQLRAKSSKSDFALLELSSFVPNSYNVCYSGWDATDFESTTLSAYGIHHPRGDVKKFCREQNAPYHESTPFNNNNDAQMWWINQWEDGVTEPGSSGSPLFNQSSRIIGMLSGGAAACIGSVNNGGYDFYGRFGVAWDYGTTSDSNLKSWLDQAGTGLEILDGLCAGSPLANDATLTEFGNVSIAACDFDPIQPVLNFVNTGIEPISSLSVLLSQNNADIGLIEYTGNLSPLSSSTLALGSVIPMNGENTLTATIIAVNGSADFNTNGNVLSKTYYRYDDIENYYLSITLDDYPEETSWSVQNIDNQNEIYSGSGYGGSTNFVNEQLCLASNYCYRFDIFDAADDGICCLYGQGSWNLYNEQDEVVGSGGSFSSVQTQTFCTGYLKVRELSNQAIRIFPNPASDHFTIERTNGNLEDVTKITIIDAMGRAILKTRPKSHNGLITVDVSTLVSGLYLVKIDLMDTSISQKVLVTH